MRLRPEPLRRAATAIQRRRELWARWQRLSRQDRLQILRFSGLIPAAALSLRVFGYHRTLRILAWHLRPAQQTSIEEQRTGVQALRRASRYAPYRGNCLSQSLALWWVLRRARCRAEICFGAAMNEGTLMAHAWVESQGLVLNDSPDIGNQFARFLSSASPGQ